MIIIHLTAYSSKRGQFGSCQLTRTEGPELAHHDLFRGFELDMPEGQEPDARSLLLALYRALATHLS